MTEGNEVRASHEEVVGFVGKLRGFHDSLSDSEQAMLGTILEGAQVSETGGYAFKVGRYGGGSEDSSQEQPWNDLVGWVEERGEEGTQGFLFKVG
jgi:hypothetical protein